MMAKTECVRDKPLAGMVMPAGLTAAVPNVTVRWFDIVGVNPGGVWAAALWRMHAITAEKVIEDRSIL
jgi:hypothetical protein